MIFLLSFYTLAMIANMNNKKGLSGKRSICVEWIGIALERVEQTRARKVREMGLLLFALSLVTVETRLYCSLSATVGHLVIGFDQIVDGFTCYTYTIHITWLLLPCYIQNKCINLIKDGL